MRRRLISVALVLALGCAACAGDDPATGPSPVDSADSDEPASDSTTSLTITPDGGLSAVRFVGDTAAPFDEVELTGLPDGIDPAGLTVSLAADPAPITLPLSTDGDTVRLLVPPFPTAPFDGGALDLTVTDGDTDSPPLTLTVDALQSAPGAWDEWMQAQRDYLDAAARQLGTSYDELAASPAGSLPAQLWHLRVAQAWLDDGSEHDIESLYTADVLTDDDRALVDAIVAALGLVEAVGTPGTLTLATDTPLSTIEPSPDGFARPHGFAAPRQQPATCIDSGIEVRDAADLADKIATAADAAIREGGAEDRVLDAIGDATTGLGMIPEIGPAFGAIGTGFAGIRAAKNGAAGLYPSQLGTLTAHVDDVAFLEDFTISKYWSQVEVIATSTGWEAYPDIADVYLAAAGTVVSGVGGASVVEGFFVSAAQVLRDNAARDLIAEQAAEGDIVAFCADRWTVDITGAPWSTGRAIPEVFTTDDAVQSFEPIEAGRDAPYDTTLRIEANPDRFAGRSAFTDFPVSVAAIDVDAPERIEVTEPGETVTIQVTVRDAWDATLEWDPGNGGWAGDARLVSSSGVGEPGSTAVWERDHVTPSSADRYDYVIGLTSTASTGLRPDPPRTAAVEVRLAPIIVTPDPASVETRGQIGFAATDQRGNPIEVRWTATGGTIPAGPSTVAVYTAGDEPGSYELTASLPANPDVSVTVPIHVGEFCLQGTWQINAAAFASILSAGGQTVTPVDGAWYLTVAEDGTFTSTLDGFALKIATGEVEATMVMNGSQTGRVLYTATHIEGVETTSHALEVTVVTPVGPIRTSAEDAPIGTELGGGPYRCEGGQLIVSRDGYDILYDRIG